MSGSVDVQSRARRSYKAVVIPTDALLTLGMLKLTSLILAGLFKEDGRSYCWLSHCTMKALEECTASLVGATPMLLLEAGTHQESTAMIDRHLERDKLNGLFRKCPE
jgi:hypothetical protein